MTLNAAKLHINAMIVSHLSNCFDKLGHHVVYAPLLYVGACCVFFFCTSRVCSYLLLLFRLVGGFMWLLFFEFYAVVLYVPSLLAFMLYYCPEWYMLQYLFSVLVLEHVIIYCQYYYIHKYIILGCLLSSVWGQQMKTSLKRLTLTHLQFYYLLMSKCFCFIYFVSVRATDESDD